MNPGKWKSNVEAHPSQSPKSASTKHTLADLRSAPVDGIRHLVLSEGLDRFPEEIFDHSETLEILDLSGNRLHSLPDSFARLSKLRIAFFSANDFETFPEILGRCPSLEMVGFKSNRIALVPEDALPERLRWLILTDNLLHALPASLGNRPRLQKLMLAGNCLESLPDLSRCGNLELARLSANRLPFLPDSLLELPRLSWLAFSGNPFCRPHHPDSRSISWSDLALEEKIGEGASGVVFRAIWHAPAGSQEVALKVFKGGVTSDGRTSDEEAATLAVGTHPHLVPILGRLEGHPDGLEGLVLELIPAEFRTLARPPSFESCTRDVYPAESRPSRQAAQNIAKGMSSLLEHIHEHGVCHGDLYAHNILVNDGGHALLGDFGAAGFLDDLPRAQAQAVIEIERRALRTLESELLG